MIRIDFDKVESTYTREVELKPNQHVKFYGFLFLISLIIFVFLGIRPTLISYSRDSRYRTELKDLRSTMRKKLEDLKVAEKDLAKIASKENILYNRLPENRDVQNFLREFVVAASKSGFIVDKLRMRMDEEGSISLSIQLKGSITNIPKLTSDIEKLSRITTIDEINSPSSEKERSINLYVTTYYLPRGGKEAKEPI